MKGVFQAKLILVVLAALVLGAAALLQAQTATTTTTFRASDPGVRGGDPGAGGPIDGLTTRQGVFFDVGKDEFEDVDGMSSLRRAARAPPRIRRWHSPQRMAALMMCPSSSR